MVFNILLALWFLSGSASFIFWWTKDQDFNVSEVPLALVCGLLGPISFILGWFMHGDKPSFIKNPLVKKRGR